MRKSLFAASMLALTVAVAPACATKKFVRTEVGNVNTKVDTLSGTVEETQERTRQNEERIGAVDRRLKRPASAATEARAAAARRATAAAEAARRPRRRSTRVDAVEPRSAASRPPRLRSDAQRGSGQLQVRQTRAAGRSQGAPRPDGQPAEDRSEERLHRDRRPHGQRRLGRRSTSGSAWSAPKR